MQTDYKKIYNLTAKKTGKDEILYKDIGNFVFAELYSMFRKPNSLIIKLKGVGFWFLRRKKVTSIVTLFPPDYEKKQEDFSNEYEFKQNENRKELHSIFIERLKDYERYTELRKEIRQERNKTQVLLKPKSEDES